MKPRARRTPALLALALVGALLAWWVDGRGVPEAPRTAVPAPAADAATLARGEALARAGHCAGCHTARGGEPYAGGRGIATPFGTIVSTNLTPDVDTGLGAWTAADFRRALHEGRSRDGRALYPAFPYTSYTKVTDADADALFAWLRTLPPVDAPARPHALRFPWSLPPLLAAWRWRYFEPGRFVPDASRPPEWNRGAYLVQGLGHCGECHGARDALGGPSGAPLAGGDMGPAGWHAPSLLDAREGATRGWPVDEAADFLAAGIGARGVATGPMSEVVRGSLQHLPREDLVAIAAYLGSLPDRPVAPRRGAAPADAATRKLGARTYREHCADCHGDRGEGEPPHLPALAGSRTLSMVSPVNAIRAVLHGGFAPGTTANPKPWGMPPFGPVLSDREVAALVGWMRADWGGGAGAVEAREVERLRGVPVD